jgi:hypothetical protein|tara:strand:+ start:408 stop:680 length:273 start_codon:yes stop_codon:yes gene_type:complete
MNNQEIDPDNLPTFQIPDSFLNKLFELTGNEVEKNRGFVLSYVSHDGRPLVYARAETQIIEMGLRKALEKYLAEVERCDDAQSLGPETED